MHFNVFFFLSIKEIKQISICVQARDLKKSIQTLRNWATNQKEPQQLLIYKLHQYHFVSISQSNENKNKQMESTYYSPSK